jgi:hypothetical protein
VLKSLSFPGPAADTAFPSPLFIPGVKFDAGTMLKKLHYISYGFSRPGVYRYQTIINAFKRLKRIIIVRKMWQPVCKLQPMGHSATFKLTLNIEQNA